MKKTQYLLLTILTALLIAGFWRHQMQTPDQYWDDEQIKMPDQKQLQLLIDRQIQERESQLDQQIGTDIDQILDQQAMEARLSGLTKNVTTTREPSQSELNVFFQQHREQYREASQFRFKQLIFSKKKYGGQAVSKAQESLIRTKTDSEYAMQLKANAETSEFTSLQLDETYGQGYSEKILELTAHSLPCWSQPITSIEGAHLLCIEKVKLGKIPTLESVRSQAINHWRHANAEN